MAYEFIAKHGLITPGSAQVTGSLRVLGGIYGDLTGTASWARNVNSASWASRSISSSNADTASYALNISPADTASFAITASYTENYKKPTATNFYFPFWYSHSLTDTSGISVDSDIYHYINGNSFTASATDKPALTVTQVDVNNVNIIRASGNANNYLQIVLRNFLSASNASSDMVVEADNATETSSYVDMGINSSGWDSSSILNSENNNEQPNDAYIVNIGGDLWISPNETGAGRAIRMGVGNNFYSSMSLVIDEAHGVSASGSLYGTASYANLTPRAIRSDSSSFLIP